MMLWESLVPQMVVFRLPVLHRLCGMMIQIIMRFLWQRMRLFYMNDTWKSMVTPYRLGFLPWEGFDNQFLT